MAFEGEEFIRVECHAGHRGEETPRRFQMGNRMVEVAEIVDQWPAPEHRYFKVTGGDGGSYILRHDTPTGRWALVMYERHR